MTQPVSFDDLQAILHQGIAHLPDHRKPSPNTRYTMQDAALVLRFRNNVMVFGPGLLPQWEALRWSLRSLSPKDVSHAWSATELPP